VLIPERTGIDQRPAHIADRSEYGHWEGDTAVSRKGPNALMILQERNLDRDTITSLITMEWIDRGEPLLITGPTGAGKSYLACAFGHEACLRGISTRYVRATKLFPTLRLARADGSYFDEIKRFAKTSLLIIDDFGLAPLNADDRLALLELLDDRYNKLGTIITGQVPISVWHDIIGEPTVADAIMDRLAHTPWIFELKGASRRRQVPSH
jgi:DNA replication protein DnaC